MTLEEVGGAFVYARRYHIHIHQMRTG